MRRISALLLAILPSLGFAEWDITNGIKGSHLEVHLTDATTDENDVVWTVTGSTSWRLTEVHVLFASATDNEVTINYTPWERVGDTGYEDWQLGTDPSGEDVDTTVSFYFGAGGKIVKPNDVITVAGVPDEDTQVDRRVVLYLEPIQ